MAGLQRPQSACRMGDTALPQAYRHLPQDERFPVHALHQRGASADPIAGQLWRHELTIRREIQPLTKTAAGCAVRDGCHACSSWDLTLASYEGQDSADLLPMVSPLTRMSSSPVPTGPETAPQRTDQWPTARIRPELSTCEQSTRSGWRNSSDDSIANSATSHRLVSHEDVLRVPRFGRSQQGEAGLPRAPAAISMDRGQLA